MKCPICGMVRDDQAPICPRCGYDQATESRQTFCPECGTPVPRQAKACLMCEASLEDTEQVSRVRRIPLPRIPWLPVRLPESIRLSLVVAGLVAVVVVVLLLRLSGPLLAQNPQPDRAVHLVTPAALSLPTSTWTATATRTPTDTPTITPTPSKTPVDVYHVVAPGENPGSIAAHYDMSIEQIMAANDIKDPRSLRVGQSLLIPPTWTEVSAAAPAGATPSPTPMAYTVQVGDNLSSIAIWAGTSVEAIMKLNKLENPRWLSVGQQLLLPAGATGKAGTATPTPDIPVAIHIVEPGDSLLALAGEYSTSVQAIMEANHIDDARFIRTGESLIVPLGTPTPTALPTPLPTTAPTPGPRYPSPVPLSPPKEEYFWGDSQPILLNWMSVGVLGDEDWYLVDLKHVCEGKETATYGWTRSTSWRVPQSVCREKEAEHLFRWQVQVVHSSTPESDLEQARPLSPVSETRTFYWY
jgi:LysM repeat protein